MLPTPCDSDVEDASELELEITGEVNLFWTKPMLMSESSVLQKGFISELSQTTEQKL